MLRKVLSCGWYMHFIQIRNSEMKFVLIILFSTCACCMQAQVNLIRNGGMEEKTGDTCGIAYLLPSYSPINIGISIKERLQIIFKVVVMNLPFLFHTMRGVINLTQVQEAVMSELEWILDMLTMNI
jgi:hypothetical protein